MATTSVAFFGDMMLTVPDRYESERRGWEVIAGAYAHAVWDEGWRALTGKSWGEWQASRYSPPVPAHIEVDLYPDSPYRNAARVTQTGVLHLRNIRPTAKAGKRGKVRMSVPMTQVTVRTHKP